MTVPASRIIDEIKAAEMLHDILESLDNGFIFSQVCECINPDGSICEDNIYKVANILAFADCSVEVPEIAREFVASVLLDEIELDNKEAMLDFGSLYYTGRIGEQSYAQAVKYYKMAYEHGSAIASENLGYCYYYGRDVEVDYKKAYHYFIKAAMVGRTESIYKIGDMYAKGLYVEKDEEFAFALYEKAFQAMDDECDVRADVCLRMGNAFYYGVGTEKNIHTALFFFQQAEYHYYQQIAAGDYFKHKMLEGAIEKINKIRDEIKAELN